MSQLPAAMTAALITGAQVPGCVAALAAASRNCLALGKQLPIPCSRQSPCVVAQAQKIRKNVNNSEPAFMVIKPQKKNVKSSFFVTLRRIAPLCALRMTELTVCSATFRAALDLSSEILRSLALPQNDRSAGSFTIPGSRTPVFPRVPSLDSRFPILESRFFTIHDQRFTINDSRSTINDSR